MWRNRSQRDPQRSTGGPTHTDDDALLASAEQAGRGHPLIVGFTAGVLMVVAIVLVWAQNGQSVDFEWAFFDVGLPLWAVAVGGMVVGVLAAGATAILGRAARRRSTVHRSALDRLESRRQRREHVRAA